MATSLSSLSRWGQFPTFTGVSPFGYDYPEPRRRAQQGRLFSQPGDPRCMARIICTMLKNQEEYRDPGADYYEEQYLFQAG